MVGIRVKKITRKCHIISTVSTQQESEVMAATSYTEGHKNSMFKNFLICEITQHTYERQYKATEMLVLKLIFVMLFCIY